MSALTLLDLIFDKGELKRPVNIGASLRDRGIEDAYDKAVRIKSEYVETCLSAIRSFPQGASITSEDIREKAGDPPADIDASVLSGIMRTAASKQHKLIMITRETRQGKRPSLRAKHLSIWVRL